MPTPSTSAVKTDINSVPAPQFWDNVNSTYDYNWGNGLTKEIFVSGAIIVPDSSPGYVTFRVAKSSAGVFFQTYGTYKGTTAAWIMMFDAAGPGVPNNGTAPLCVVALGPAIGGADLNWFLAPGKPYQCSNGVLVALSTTGGTFTASANTDVFITTEYK